MKMFQGLRTVIYKVGDLEQAKVWYSTVLEIEPYFDEPFYIGFDVGGFELGLQPATAGPSRAGDSVITYWGVSQIEAAVKRLLELGATIHEEIQDVGGNIRVASVIDPFSNIVGIIENPHFSLESTKPSAHDS
jgi:predicted enzyme related to lactoylglutathione lyase